MKIAGIGLSVAGIHERERTGILEVLAFTPWIADLNMIVRQSDPGAVGVMAV